MAGPKESPRQQMINLMYLVLTALLALQVSSSIIDKFLYIKRSLDHSADDTEADIVDYIKGFKSDAEKEKMTETEEYKKKLAAIEQVRSMTKAKLDMLAKIESDIIDKAGGGRDENGKIKNAGGGETQLEELMLGAANSKSGEGYKLQREMNLYAQELGKIVGAFKKDIKPELAFPALCLDNKDRKDLVKLKGNEEEINKDYAQASFQATPVAAALAVLAHLRTEVKRYEDNAIKIIGAKVIPPTPDVFSAQLALESAVVAQGQKIRGKMFIVASSSKSDMQPKFEVTGLKEVKNGVAEIEFTPSGNGVIKGKVTAILNGKETVLETEPIEYKVAKPNITVDNPQARPVVYEECFHKFNVSCAEIGASFQPSYAATNAQLIDRASNSVSFIPAKGAKTVDLTITGNGLKEIKQFNVRRVPSPDVFVIIGGGKFAPEKGVKPKQIFNVTIEPNDEFASILPNEAKYEVQINRVTLIKGTNAKSGSINELAPLSEPGARYEVSVIAYRINSRGQRVQAAVRDPIIIPVK
ncbi:type IX secretion system motor protein PorM/GldM [Raineya orbicola]|uniref:GldM N-terminal domain n=1 Tax=Raineya orbicola TaxID=2016530 RepID=A0A2N3II69_9BACT|nr:GldM family protein [Raineya orbicola]PKQ70040.1 GldM N-terminal domain [Raineya orbicola]